MKLDEVIQQPGAKDRLAEESLMRKIHVALPGTVTAYDAATRTVTVQPSIRRINTTEAPPVLRDVPVFFPGNMLFPVQKGDECLVIFADRCIDGWFAHGGLSSAMLDRMHDLSDGFALVGFFSRPKATGGVNVLSKLEELEQRIETLEGGGPT